MVDRRARDVDETASDVGQEEAEAMRERRSGRVAETPDPVLDWLGSLVERRRRRPLVSAFETIACTLGALTFAALLGSGSLVGLAERQDFGWQRDSALAVARTVDGFSRALRLDQPSDAIREALGRQHEEIDIEALISGEDGSTRPASDAEPAPPGQAVGATTTAPPWSQERIANGSAHAAGGSAVAAGGSAVAAGSSADSEEAGVAVDSQPGPAIASPETVGGGVSAGSTGKTRQVTVDDPLEIWLAGDSMMRELGRGVEGQLPPDLASSTLHYRVSSGLTRPDFYDWPQRIARGLVEEEPDVFVVMFGANDNVDMETDAGLLRAGSPAWDVAYAERVGRAMDLMSQPGVRTVWVGLPIMRSDAYNRNVARLNAIYRAEAERRSSVTFLPTWDLMADGSGAYAERLVDEAGDLTTMRQEDGIHLSLAGADRVGAHVWDTIAAEWGVDVEAE